MPKLPTQLFAFPLKLKIPNGYWDGLYDELLRQRPDVVAHNNDFWGLFKAFGSHNIIHIHWPTIMYASRHTWMVSGKLFLRILILTLAKLRGDTLVWTMHNYRDHESRYPTAEKVAVRFLVLMADSIIVHTHAGIDHIQQQFHRTHGLHVVPHGSYVNFHGPRLTEPDSDLRQHFGLQSTDCVFLSLGSIRRYKGLEKIVEQFNKLPKHVKLIIAGKSFNPEYLELLRAQSKNQNVLFFPKTVANNDIPKFFSLASASVYAFTEVLTSGSVILSQSYGVPVIVPDSGDLHYIVEDGINGFRYRTNDELFFIINRIVSMSHNEIKAFHEQTFQNILSLNFKSIAAQTLAAYHLA